MKLTLEQNNIETALRAYLQSNYGLSLRNKVAVMDFTAGRGKNGLSVLVTINDANIPGEDTSDSVSQLIDSTKKVSATDKRIADQKEAKDGTVGSLLNTAEVQAKVETAPAPVAEVAEVTLTVEEAASTAVAVEDPTPVAEVEVPAVSTEDTVAAEVVDPVKPPPKTSSGLFS